MVKGKVSIVGAGPGDPELLTLKAHRRLKEAEVVLHDSLISQGIMDFIPESATKIYVGKRLGDKQDQSVRQNEINRLLVSHALEGKRCVRLKSGDPFVFGRGVEEVRALLEHGIDVEVIPGISAGIAAANLCYIPITERYKSSSVLFCTGHTAEYTLEHLEAVALLMQAGTPLVLYMGLKNLESVAAKLISVGIAPETPVCAVSRVSYPDQDMICGTLETAAATLAEADLKTPTVFLIGKHARPADVLFSQTIQNELQNEE